MYVMIDNYDSFVFNLTRYFEELGEQISVVRNDQLIPEVFEQAVDNGDFEGLILSPGPKSPKDCGICSQIVRRMAPKLPILGVCLGHQIIGDAVSFASDQQYQSSQRAANRCPHR